MYRGYHNPEKRKMKKITHIMDRTSVGNSISSTFSPCATCCLFDLLAHVHPPYSTSRHPRHPRFFVQPHALQERQEESETLLREQEHEICKRIRQAQRPDPDGRDFKRRVLSNHARSPHKGGQLRKYGLVVNVAQDITFLPAALPNLAADVPITIIRRKGQ